ncbi:hypothetical protein [Limosilactobacillus caccae]|uniref:hypothetical protein n=1 Tax=Limosilactobacillus caccae TaxID=1926284 RepID=UPI0009709A2A|nr:hypothetical protein [Limosilactobacillus caccae]
MKAIYRVDETGIHHLEVNDNYELQACELLAQPEIIHSQSPTERLLMQQSQQITLLQSTVMQQNQTNAKLQAANIQQANQIKQLQQMFMQTNQQQAIAKSKEEVQQ